MLWFDSASEMVAKLLTVIFAVLGGQYGAGPLGVGGGLLVVAYGLAVLCSYWRWGFAILQGTRPIPGPGLCDPASRQEMCSAFWHIGVSALGPWFLLRGLLGGYTLQPECPPSVCHNATVMLNHVSSVALLEGKVSYSAPFGPKTQSNNLILAVVFGGIVPFWVWRRGIYGLITRPCVGKQRLADGAFIAALLLAMDEGDGDGDGGGEKQDRDLVADAAVLMRRIPMSRVTLQMLGASPRDENYDASASYSMGEACGLGGCDFFVSHSWGDDPRAKYAQLMAVTLLFRRKHGRDPTLWLDKCCTPIISLDIDMVPFRFFKRRVCGSAGINQEDIARTLRCLPVFVQSCSKLLILSGDSYANRLWCAWELYVHFAMSGVHASKRTAVVDCRSNKEHGARTDSTATSDSVVVVDNPTAAETSEPAAVEATGPAEAGPAEALCTFRVEDAHCFSPEDEARLRRVIESESAESFNNAIREAGQAVALLGKDLELQEQFAELDANRDGRLDRSDLLAAFGWADAKSEETLAARSAQIDDLLEVINTDGELRVNGGLSIGEAEFRKWLARAG